MKSRANLLAEIEENSRKNKGLNSGEDELQLLEPEIAEGYDPYDNPGIHKESNFDDTMRRRSLWRRQGRR